MPLSVLSDLYPTKTNSWYIAKQIRNLLATPSYAHLGLWLIKGHFVWGENDIFFCNTNVSRIIFVVRPDNCRKFLIKPYLMSFPSFFCPLYFQLVSVPYSACILFFLFLPCLHLLSTEAELIDQKNISWIENTIETTTIPRSTMPYT
jgi:hypothetical protein